jgi:hypothetical protein
MSGENGIPSSNELGIVIYFLAQQPLCEVGVGLPPLLMCHFWIARICSNFGFDHSAKKI